MPENNNDPTKDQVIEAVDHAAYEEFIARKQELLAVTNKLNTSIKRLVQVVDVMNAKLIPLLETETFEQLFAPDEGHLRKNFAKILLDRVDSMCYLIIKTVESISNSLEQ
jgi:hypothetical protein